MRCTFEYPMMVEYTCYLTDILDYWVTQQICISMCICSCLTIVFTKNTVKHLSLYTLERHNCGGREELQWSWKRVYMPRNKGSSQNVIQQQVGSLDTYTFAWVSAVSNHISPKFYDVNHINYVLQCAKTFYAFFFLSMDHNLDYTNLRHVNYLTMEAGCKMWGSITESEIAALKSYASFLPQQPMFSREKHLQVLYKGETCNLVLSWARKRKYIAFCFLGNVEI